MLKYIRWSHNKVRANILLWKINLLYCSLITRLPTRGFVDLGAGPTKKYQNTYFVLPSEKSSRIRIQESPNSGVTQNVDKRVLIRGRGRKVTGIDCYRPIETIGEGFSKCAAAGRAAWASKIWGPGTYSPDGFPGCSLATVCKKR